MKSTFLLGAAAASLGVLAPGAAQAALLTFSGTATASAATAPDPTCAPYAFRGIIAPQNSTGNSNLGAFTYAHNACTEGPKTPVSLQNGAFTIDFGYGAISGNFIGETRPRSGVPGLFDQLFTYTILGGTGQFMGATGTFGNIGTVDIRNAPPSVLNFSFSGLINAPVAVPEPGTWAMLILAFFGMGAAQRSRNARAGKALRSAKA